MRQFNGRLRGLTALEVVIIIMVLGVVGYITYPKFELMLHQSREGRTKANLGDLRGAIAIYYSDNFGLYPSDEGSPETRLVDALTPTYLKAIPPVELPHLYSEQLNTVQDRLTDKGDWMYSTLNGFIAVNSSRLDTEGRAISSW
jgi:type II secretory pathway pseudopilin PulG